MKNQVRSFTAGAAMMSSFAFASPSGAAEPSIETRPATRPNRSLLVAGTATFGLSYGAAAVTSVLYLVIVYPIPGLICEAADKGHCSPQASPLWLMVPVAGPLVAAHSLSAPKRDHINMFENNTGTKAVFYVDAALQALGAGLLASAFLFREEKPVSTAKETHPSWKLAGIAPLPVLGGAGLSVVIQNY